MTALERAEARAILLKEAVDVAARLQANEAEHAELIARRARTCRALREAGTPVRDLQEALGLSRSRVNQVLTGTT